MILWSCPLFNDFLFFLFLFFSAQDIFVLLYTTHFCSFLCNNFLFCSMQNISVLFGRWKGKDTPNKNAPNSPRAPLVVRCSNRPEINLSIVRIKICCSVRTNQKWAVEQIRNQIRFFDHIRSDYLFWWKIWLCQIQWICPKKICSKVKIIGRQQNEGVILSNGRAVRG